MDDLALNSLSDNLIQIVKDSQQSSEEIKKADAYIKNLSSQFESSRMDLSERTSNIELLKQQLSQKDEMLAIKDSDTSSAKQELSKQ